MFLLWHHKESAETRSFFLFKTRAVLGDVCMVPTMTSTIFCSARDIYNLILKQMGISFKVCVCMYLYVSVCICMYLYVFVGVNLGLIRFSTNTYHSYCEFNVSLFLGDTHFIEHVHMLGTNFMLAILKPDEDVSQWDLCAPAWLLDEDVSRWDLRAPAWIIAPAWCLVSLNHANVILSQWWFIEHLHMVGVEMILVIIEIRWWYRYPNFLRVGMTFDVSEIRHQYYSRAIIFNSAMSARYWITLFGYIRLYHLWGG